MLTFRRNTHRFFDDLVAFFASVSSLGIAFDAHRTGSTNAYRPTDYVTLEGTRVTNIEVRFFPYPLMQILIANRWPEEIVLDDRALQSSPSSHPPWLTGLQGVHGSMIESAFVRYFESLRPTIEAKHTTDPERWPTALNFARVVRNAFAHGGQITFRSPTASAVSWRSLTYGPADNGRQILYQDMTAVEITLLMQDMDSAV